MVKDPKIDLKLKELNLLIKEQKCVAKIIRICIEERKAERDITIRKMEL